MCSSSATTAIARGLWASPAPTTGSTRPTASLPNSPRNSLEFLVGVTQALSVNSIIQSNLTYYTGHGYYSDPYKTFDTRPSERRTFAWLTRYNQYFPDPDGTLKLGYRLLFDSFGDTTNMVEAAWAQALPYGFTLTPGLRYYTQSAADFYYNPPWPTGYVDGSVYTADTRLAAFGAITAGVIVGKTLWDGSDRVIARRLLSAGSRLAHRRFRQRGRAVVRGRGQLCDDRDAARRRRRRVPRRAAVPVARRGSRRNAASRGIAGLTNQRERGRWYGSAGSSSARGSLAAFAARNWAKPG